MNLKFFSLIAIIGLSSVVYSTLAFGVPDPDVIPRGRVQNHENCSLDYFRLLVMKSCESLNRPKTKRSLFVVPETTGVVSMDMPFLQRYAIENNLPQMIKEELPPNIAMIARDTVTARARRNAQPPPGKKVDHFLFCCKNPSACESLPCPAGYKIKDN